MKNLLVLLLLLSCVSTLFAQEDRFYNVDQAKGKEIYILDNSLLDVAYTLVNGKVKPINKKKNTISVKKKVYTADNEFYSLRRKNYLVLRCADQTILLNEQDAPSYLPSFVSKTYWQEKFENYKIDYIYMDISRYRSNHHSEANVLYDELSPIKWVGFSISDNGAKYYMSEHSDSTTLDKFPIESNFFEARKDEYFISKDNIQPYIDKYNARLAQEEQERRVADSIADTKLRLAKALKNATFKDDEGTTHVYEGDTLAVYYYKPSTNKFVARFRWSNIILSPEDIEFLDTKTTKVEGKYSWETKTEKSSEDAEYLKRRGLDSLYRRFIPAFEYDNTHSEIWLKQLKAEYDEYTKEIAYRKKNQIFITGIGYAFKSSSYSSRCGMRFDVYNCFTKTIKYVEFTITCYNAVGDVQRDDIGRSSRTVRGIGPIEPGEGGRYTWDDIFWDDRDIISRMKLTKIKFIFKDGTTKLFSGAVNIDKHMTYNAWSK